MMTKKQWSALLCLHISYLLLGASIFYNIEGPLEMERRLEERREKVEIQRLLQENYLPEDPAAFLDILALLTDYCGHPMMNVTHDEEPAPVWDFYHSFFFSYTVVSTIGYGNLAPTTSFGRILMIFYGVIGIPLNGILFANLGEFFGNAFRGLYNKYKSKNPSSGSSIDYQLSRLGLFGQITIYLIPGFLFFIFLPACFFVIFEGWDYVLAVYYAFVTLTTIGFGDYVAGITDKGYGIYFTIYKIFLIVWITFGLGYLVMVFGFITRGLKSKRMLELERRLATNIKVTQNKIWNGVTKDVGYLRRMLNEVYMMRFKPVYQDEVPVPRMHRSSSCPSLLYAREEDKELGRRRANSEAFAPAAGELQRVQSDSDLLAIDRNRTFAVSAMVQPAELLARVVDALGSLQNNEVDTFEEYPDDQGVHGFSDTEILATERAGSAWSVGVDRLFSEAPSQPRARAASEIKVPMPGNRDRFYSDNEWTWSNTASTHKIKEMIKTRQFGKNSVPTVPAISIKSVSDTDNSEKNSSNGFISKLNPFRNSKVNKFVENQKSKLSPSKDDEMTPAEYLKRTARGRATMLPAQERKLFDPTKKTRSSNISLPTENADLLEQTTIADLIRALTALHTAETVEPPRRKLGTASLTPPKLPSLLNLFPPQEQPQVQHRRFSVHPAIITPTEERRQSLTPLPPAVARRRLSLHPGASFRAPSSFSPHNIVRGEPRRGSMLSPPPYASLVSSPGFRRRAGSMRRPSLRAAGPASPLVRQTFLTRPETARTRHESLIDVRVDELKLTKNNKK